MERSGYYNRNNTRGGGHYGGRGNGGNYDRNKGRNIRGNYDQHRGRNNGWNQGPQRGRGFGGIQKSYRNPRDRPYSGYEKTSDVRGRESPQPRKSVHERPAIKDEDLKGKTDEEVEMIKVMGFGEFDTTKGRNIELNYEYIEEDTE